MATSLFVDPAFAAPPRAEAVFAPVAPRIDGSMRDPIWATAIPIRFPEADSSNEVRFLWNASGLFLGFQTTDPSLHFGKTPVGNSLHEEDVFEFFFDPRGDHRQYVEAQINPAGRFFAKNYVLTARPRLTKEGRLTQPFVESELWRYEIPLPTNAQLDSRVDRPSGKWTLEMFLPADWVNRREGGTPLRPGVWRINLVRHDWTQALGTPDRPRDFQYWAPVLPGNPHISPTLMGYLKLMKPAKK